MKKKYRVGRIILFVCLFGLAAGGCWAKPSGSSEPPASATAVIFGDSSPVPGSTMSSEVAQAGGGQIQEDAALFQKGLIPSQQEWVGRMATATLYRIEMTIPPDLNQIEGREQVFYTNQESAPLEEICFVLHVNRAGGETSISQVRLDGQPVEPDWDATRFSACLPLSQPLQPAVQVEIEMDFTATIPREMGGNFGLYGYFDDVLVLDEFYPLIPVYDEAGWHNAEPSPTGDVTYNDASFYEVQVTAPADLVLVATGAAVDEVEKGEEKTLTYAAGPVRDFYLAASSKFKVVDETVGDTVIHSYFVSDGKEQEEVLGIVKSAIQSYGARFGEYPYTELDVVSTPMQALGMEYPGVIAIALDLYIPGGTISGIPTPALLESTLAHEVAHQYFYNVVGSDQIDEPWVDEAVTQYVTSLYYIDRYGESAADSYRASWYSRWDRVDRAEIPIGLPAEAYSMQEYSPIVYGRGPLFVLTLAEQMGLDSFDAFLRAYVQENWWGIGTANEFKQLAEDQCQCNLDDLFKKWVY